MGSNFIAGVPHPPKDKYFLSVDITNLQGGRHDGDPHTTRYDPQDGLKCRGQASCMGLLQGEAGAVLRDCWHSQGSPGDPHSLLWWQGGFRAMDSLEGPGGGEQR